MRKSLISLFGLQKLYHSKPKTWDKKLGGPLNHLGVGATCPCPLPSPTVRVQWQTRYVYLQHSLNLSFHSLHLFLLFFSSEKKTKYKISIKKICKNIHREGIPLINAWKSIFEVYLVHLFELVNVLGGDIDLLVVLHRYLLNIEVIEYKQGECTLHCTSVHSPYIMK